jgi:DNA-binding MarR family transcriptional regulator
MPQSYYKVESLEAQRSVGFLIKRCGVLMTQIAERAFESHSISFTQWMILMRLSACPHASPSELSAQIGHDMGALTRIVDELERKGFVTRERCPHDRRAVQIAITADGRRLADGGKPAVVGLLNKLIGPYTEAEIEALISLLQRFLVQLQEVAQAATPLEPAPVAEKQRGTRAATRAGPSKSRTTPKAAR